MKNLMSIFGAILFASFFLIGCGGSCDPKTDETTDTPKETAPAISIDATTWEAADLSTVSTMIPIMLNLPKDVKTEKNMNGGVDIFLNDAMILTVSNLFVSTVADAIQSEKDYTVNNSSYINSKLVVDEPNGFVYTYQMKDEENGFKYEAESHFIFYLEKDGAIYSVKDERPMDNYFLPGSTYTEENAVKLYEAIKASATIK